MTQRLNDSTTIRLYTESDRDNWDKYVMKSNSSNCYHLTGWKNVIEKSFGHKTYYLLSEDENLQINGILPLVHLKNILFGNFMVSLPYFNYGGVCADNDEVSTQLLDEAAIIASTQKIDHIEFRHVSKAASDLPVKTSKVSMKLTLPQTKEELWTSFPSKLRSQAQRPIREQMYAKVGRLDELDNFYDIFSQNMRDLGTPVYSKSFFRNILHEFPTTTWISTVYTKEDQPVASGFLVAFKETMEIPWASSLRAFNKLSPNMLLYWSVLEFACNQEFKMFDFGRSTPHEGTYKFKAQWGAKPIQLYWHYWMKNGGPLPEINPHNPKYEMAIKVWRRFPIGLTRLIGPHIVKNLP
jgi:serine/alanine adding enzyme